MPTIASFKIHCTTIYGEIAIYSRAAHLKSRYFVVFIVEFIV